MPLTATFGITPDARLQAESTNANNLKKSIMKLKASPGKLFLFITAQKSGDEKKEEEHSSSDRKGYSVVDEDLEVMVLTANCQPKQIQSG
jgi:hypothetical protein